MVFVAVLKANDENSRIRIRIRIWIRIQIPKSEAGSADPDPDPHQNVMDPEHWPQGKSRVQASAPHPGRTLCWAWATRFSLSNSQKIWRNHYLVRKTRCGLKMLFCRKTQAPRFSLLLRLNCVRNNHAHYARPHSLAKGEGQNLF